MKSKYKNILLALSLVNVYVFLSLKKFQPFNEKSRDIFATLNSKQQQHDAQDYGAQRPADVAHHNSILTENDKLPWPIPYENAERDSKWKTIRPKPNVYYKRNYVSLNHTVDINAKILPHDIESTASVSIAPTNSYPVFTTAIPSYHPYAFESIHSSPPVFYPSVQPVEFPTYPTYQPDSDIYAQPIDTNNETKLEYINAKDSLIPVQRINKE